MNLSELKQIRRSFEIAPICQNCLEDDDTLGESLHKLIEERRCIADLILKDISSKSNANVNLTLKYNQLNNSIKLILGL